MAAKSPTRKALLTVLFLVLYWLRLPLRALCNVTLLLCVVGLAAGSWGVEPFAHWRAGLLGASFAAFCARWGYDALLIRLAPAHSIIGDRYS